jgi:hypothetical protein
MEKAWSKLHRSYAATEGAMSMACAMSHLTGAPGYEIGNEKAIQSQEGQDNFFETLRLMLTKKFNLTTGTTGN